MFKYISAASTLVLFIFVHTWLAAAADQKLIEDITFETPSQEEERITFKLNGVYIPKIFAIKGENPRVVFDFPDTRTARLLNNTINTNGKFVRRIRIGFHYEPSPKTRVVFDLQQDNEIEFKHDFDRRNNALIITIYRAGTQPESKPAPEDEKAELSSEILKQAEQKTVAAQPTKQTEPEPIIPAQQKTTANPSLSSPPVKAVSQPPEKIITPDSQEPEIKQPETKPSEARPAVQQEKQIPAAEIKTAVPISTPELPTVEQEETAKDSPPPSPADQTPEAVAAEEIAPKPQKSEIQQTETKLSETTEKDRQEEQKLIVAESTEPVKTEKSSGAPIIRSITFDNSTNRGEMVLFKLNAFYPPSVFGVEEGLPRVVCDFIDAEAARDVPNVIKTNGKYVHTIRIGRDNTPKKVRVVLDLTSNRNYDLQQVFFKDDNLFVIIINSLSNSPSKEELEKPLQGSL